MSDWQSGDNALCIDDVQQARVDTGSLSAEEISAGLRFLVAGRTYTIDRVVTHWSGRQGVWLVGQTARAPYSADRFAKAIPDEIEACEPEFVTLLKRSKRKVEA